MYDRVFHNLQRVFNDVKDEGAQCIAREEDTCFLT